MPVAGLPNRFLLSFIKRTFLVLTLFLVGYIFTYIIMGYIDAPNNVSSINSVNSDDKSRYFYNSAVVVRSNQTPTTNAHFSLVHGPNRDKPRNVYIPNLIADELLSSTINITGTANRASLRQAEHQVFSSKNDSLQQQQLLVALMQSNEDASYDETENTTKLINGRIVHVRQKPISHAAVNLYKPVDTAFSSGSYGDEVLPYCSEPSPLLIGKVRQSTLLMTTLKESEVIRAHPDLSVGGSWRPSHCRPRHRVAIIVPFRDRQSHLTRLVDFLVPILKRQLLDFRFIITEQYGRDLFNKGRIMNAAFEFAEQYLRVDCVIFHDVDMFPQNDRNFYGCSKAPRHIGAFVNTLGYELWYNYIVGGALSIRSEHYKLVNGYSNMFWSWGGEDDDMGLRILANNFTIERPDPIIGRMTMLKHTKRHKTAPAIVSELLKSSGTRWMNDGLRNVQWVIQKIKHKKLYYHLYVDVGPVPEAWRSKQ